MDLEQWQALEKKQKQELEEQRRRLKSAIAAVTSGDQTTRAALEKAMMQGDAADAVAGEGASLLAAQIKVHEKLLEDHRKRGTDPISMLYRRIIDESGQSAASSVVEDEGHLAALEQYVLFDNFAAGRVQPAQVPTRDGASSSGPAGRPKAGAQGQLQQDIERSIVLSEDAVLQEMAAEYREFDMEVVRQALSVPGIAHVGTNQVPKTISDDFSQAKSSDQVMEAARTQALTPWQERLARLYDPENGVREAYLRTKYQMFVNQRLR